MKSRLLLLVLCFPLYTLSQNIHLLSSEEAVRIALENNLDIKIVKADQEIAIINNNWGNAGKWPTVVGALGNHPKGTGIGIVRLHHPNDLILIAGFGGRGGCRGRGP